MDGLGVALKRGYTTEGAKSRTLVIQFEVDEYCRRLLSRKGRSRITSLLSCAADSAGQVGSVLALTDNDGRLLDEVVGGLPSLKHVHVVGGSPCQGFSAAGGRRGLADDRSVLVWVVPHIVAKLQARGRGNFTVGFLLENVSSMTEEHRDGISRVMRVEPQAFDTASVSPCDRPRLFWSSAGHVEIMHEDVDPSAVLRPGWRPAWELAGDKRAEAVRRKFRTFLRPFGAGAPSECPVEFWRLPLSTYDERGLVFCPSAPSAMIDRAREFVHRSMRINTRDVRVSGSKALSERLRLARWIHAEGGDCVLRPLSGGERAVALGFEADDASLQDHEDVDFEALKVTGNAFSPKVVGQLLAPVIDAIVSGTKVPFVGEKLVALGREELVASMSGR